MHAAKHLPNLVAFITFRPPAARLDTRRRGWYRGVARAQREPGGRLTAARPCRCRNHPTESMRTAAALFARTNQCAAAQQWQPVPLPPAPASQRRQLRVRSGVSAAGSPGRRLLGTETAEVPADAPAPDAFQPASAGGDVAAYAGGVDGGSAAAAADGGDPATVAAVPPELPRDAHASVAIDPVADGAAAVPVGDDVAAPEEGPVFVPPEDARVEGEEADAYAARWADGIHAEMTANLRAQGWLGDFVPLRMNCPLLGRKVSPETVPQFAEAAWRCGGLGFSWECLGHREP